MSSHACNLFVECNIQNTPICTFNKIYLYTRHHFTSSNCIFMQLQGIVLIQLQGNYIFVNFQGNIFFQITYLFIQKYIHSASRKLYSFKDLYSFQGSYIHSRKIYSLKEIIFIQGHIFVQGNYIRSRKYAHSWKLSGA